MKHSCFFLSSPCKQSAYIVFVCIKGLVLIACAIILHRITSSSLSALLYLQTFVSLLVIIDFFSNTCPRNIDVYMLQRGRASEPTAKGKEVHVFVTDSRTCCACQPSKDSTRNRTVIENRPAKPVQRVSSSSP